MYEFGSGGAISVWPAILILGYVTVQRLGELWFARRNTARLRREGAVEVGAPHYSLLVAMHVAWLSLLWVMAPGEAIDNVLLTVFVLIQVFRFWTLASMGRRWTTRIMVKRGERLVRRGPYRFLSHPNYVIVALEIAILPAVFGLYAIAILFSLLNAGAMAIRIPVEARALKEFAGSSEQR